MTRSRVWQQPAWSVYPAGRLRFLAELRACGVRPAHTRINRAQRAHRGGFQVELDPTVRGLPARHVRIVFAGIGSAPFVYADGSLCMWYPFDLQEARWTRREGAAALLGHTCCPRSGGGRTVSGSAMRCATKTNPAKTAWTERSSHDRTSC